MLLTRPVLERIVAGEVDLVFRLWRRPTVKAGGRLRTVVGELAIHEVEVVDPAAVSDAEAVRAGFSDATALRAAVSPRQESGQRTSGQRTSGQGASGQRARVARPDETSRVYRVRVSYAGADPRAALREQLLSPAELEVMLARLRAMDLRAREPWVFESLRLIAEWPGRRAPELAELLGRETAPWKTQVRRLKELGLTESLLVGYRLSPRGEQVLAASGAP